MRRYFINSFLFFILVSLCFNLNCRAFFNDDERSESYYDKALKHLSNVCSYISGGCLRGSVLHFGEDQESERLLGQDIKPIQTLPTEIVFYLAAFLRPLDIINLIKSNSHFKFLESDDFWISYNKAYHYESWNREILPKQISFSYYWFKNNQVRRAALMGFPRACKLLKEQQRLKQEAQRQNQALKSPYETMFYRRVLHGNHW